MTDKPQVNQYDRSDGPKNFRENMEAAMPDLIKNLLGITIITSKPALSSSARQPAPGADTALRVAGSDQGRYGGRG